DRGRSSHSHPPYPAIFPRPAARRSYAHDAARSHHQYHRNPRMKTSAPSKSNAARLLDSLGISYELRAYDVDPEDLTAISVARKIGLPAEQVFTTLLSQANAGAHLFAVIPGDAELDFKRLAPAAGAKEAELASLNDVVRLT